MRYQPRSVHGEHATVYHVVDTAQPDSEQPAIVLSYSTADEPNARFLVLDFCERHNRIGGAE